MILRDYFRDGIDFRTSQGTLKCKWHSIHNSEDQIFDFDVILHDHPEKIKLQRPFVWSIKQQQELILSALKGIYIPPVAILLYRERATSFGGKEYHQVIDGKQRLMTLINFSENEISINVDQREFFFNDLHLYDVDVLKSCINAFIGYNDNNKLTGRQKAKWFNLLNFSGTEQEKEHMNSLNY